MPDPDSDPDPTQTLICQFQLYPTLPLPHMPDPLESIKSSLCLPSQSWMIQKAMSNSMSNYKFIS